MEFVEKEINEALERELNSSQINRQPEIVKSFMGKSAVESNLSRVWNHLNNDKGFFIISTHLTGMSEDEELERVRELRNKLTNHKPRMGYIPLRGKYTRTDTGDIEYEHSFFIPNRDIPDFKEFAMNLCKEFGQESVLFVEKGKVYFLNSDGQMDYVGNQLKSTDELNSYWSKLKKGSHRKVNFVFESLYPVNSLGLNAAHNWGELF